MNKTRRPNNGFGADDSVDSELALVMEEVSQSLATVMISRKVSSIVILNGVHAFLMALSASGHSDNKAVSAELRRMADYFSQFFA